MESSKIDYTQFKFPKGKVNKKDNKKLSKANLRRNKGINKISKKKITVSKETYQEVYERDKGLCQLCGSNNWIEAHHIRYRSERKDLIDEPNNLILLCKKCHMLVHSNKHYWQPILLKKIGGKNGRKTTI